MGKFGLAVSVTPRLILAKLTAKVPSDLVDFDGYLAKREMYPS